MSGTIVRAIPGFCQPISSLSHLAAAAVALVAAVPLIRSAAGNRTRVMAIAVYACCVVATLGISGIYHSLDRGCAARSIMMRVDHYAIWLLIAGTFTAVHGVMFQGIWRTGVLVFAWTYAAVGVSLQVYRFDIFAGTAGLALYLGLGWFGVVSIYKAGQQVGFRAVRPIWLAGVAYSAGAVLEATGHPRIVDRWVGPHEMFHLAVILGVTLHWTFIRRMVRYTTLRAEGQQPGAAGVAPERAPSGIAAAAKLA